MTKTSANAAVETTTTVPDSPLARTESIADTVTSAAPTNWSDGNLTPGPPQGEGHAVFAPFVPRLPNDFSTGEELVCRDCKLKVDPAAKGVRMLTKTTKKYQCGNCNSACTVLNYALGGWPSEEFKSWDPETNNCGQTRHLRTPRLLRHRQGNATGSYILDCAGVVAGRSRNMVGAGQPQLLAVVVDWLPA